MRVSLSDWLAFQARIRGSKAPRLLRDRPTDGAARVRRLCERWRLLCADCEVELSKMPMSVFMGGEALRLPLADGRVRWEQRNHAAIAKTTKRDIVAFYIFSFSLTGLWGKGMEA